MSTVIKNSIEDTEMADCDEEKVVTMMDVLKEQEDFEEDANAVLGASDDKNCTYSKGYIKRQAIYACLTCCSDAKSEPDKRAGVCLACSLACHENHELIELYTKRNFKCDCGNPKFSSHPCQFTPNKTDLNDDNIYNQNFSGLYCVCQRPYPDPESTIEDEMIQCIICEDWLHASHLEANVPDNDIYSEMICKGCMEKNAFLHDYSKLAVNTENDANTQPKGNDKENNKICNGVVKVDKITTADKNETLNENVDVEMTDDRDKLNVAVSENEASDSNESVASKIIIDNNQKKITETNKDEEIDKPKSLEAEKKQFTKSTDTLMNTDESNQLDSNNVTNLEVPLIKESSDKCADSKAENGNENVSATNKENIENQNISTNIEKALDTETVHQQQQNDKDSTSDNNLSVNELSNLKNLVEPNEDVIIEESAEQIKEDKHLAGPTDDTVQFKRPELEEKSINDCESQKDNIQTSESLPTATNVCSAIAITENTTLERKAEYKVSNLENNPASSNVDTQIESINREGSITLLETVSKGQDDENISKDDNLLDSGNKTEISDEEMKVDNFGENNESKIELENTLQAKAADDQICANEDTDLSRNEKASEKRKFSTEETGEDMGGKKLKVDKNIIDPCLRPKGISRMYMGATYWPATFRQKLCTCTECITMYKDLSVLFLIDPEDTVTAYENLGKQKINGSPMSQYEKGLQALSTLDRIQQINALTEYNNMRDKLVDFLKSFKERKEVVKEEDIKAFFAGIKPKREPDGVYFCR